MKKYFISRSYQHIYDFKELKFGSKRYLFQRDLNTKNSRFTIVVLKKLIDGRYLVRLRVNYYSHLSLKHIISAQYYRALLTHTSTSFVKMGRPKIKAKKAFLTLV